METELSTDGFCGSTHGNQSHTRRSLVESGSAWRQQRHKQAAKFKLSANLADIRRRSTTSGKLHNPSCSSKDSLVCACYHYCYAVDSCFQLSAAIVLSLGQFPFTMGSRTPQTRCASAGFVQLIPSLASLGGYTSWPTKTMSHTDDRRILSPWRLVGTPSL
jgi:hypothetical protein